MTIGDVIRRNAELFPARVAFVCGSRKITFATFAARVSGGGVYRVVVTADGCRRRGSPSKKCHRWAGMSAPTICASWCRTVPA